jgi:hypothetical protein
MRVANVLAEYAGFPGGFDRLTDGLAYRPSAEEARRGYAELLERARFFSVEPGDEEGVATLRSRFVGFSLTVWQDVFGPDDRHRAIAFMCHCALILLVLRRIDPRGV